MLDGTPEKEPILQQMALEDHFIEPLKRFQNLILYANVKSDPVINFGNAALAFKDLCHKTVKRKHSDADLPHVFEHSGIIILYQSLTLQISNLNTISQINT